MAQQYPSFSAFYPFYLSEHRHRTNRRLHFAGSGLVIVTLMYALLSGQWMWLLALPLLGYGFAWVGHFFFEKNSPATFKYPLYSFIGDWVMFKDILLGRIKF